MYYDVLEDILTHRHTHYVFPGGRGSTKSSFAGGVCVPLLIIQNPQCHAVCFRKVANTIQNSIFSQVVWGIYQMRIEHLFHIPKTYSTPITYLPTGQKIYFMGLDDPMKVKSIKTPFGYIGITWFEELDQYAGENELRTVTQSTMRGGNLFWDFRTFNPPISKNNWANEYTDDCETYRQDSTLVVRNTYLDVPPQWLGQEFINEAEDLKAINPKAYEHEYMGIAVGTGGDVFQNVCDMDMNEPVPRFDVYGNTIGVVPKWQTFDHIYCGLDWGFAKDPFHFVRCHFDRNHLDLYIFDEYRTMHCRNKTVFKALYEEEKKITKDELLIADSAEPKSVMDFKAYGAFIRGAEKGPDSVRYGIKWLQGLNHIYIDKRRCPYTFKEFTQYEYEMDKDGNFISAYPDEDNHSIDATRYAMEKYANRRGN
ncbi:PBSX family phage terminase large subunit [bacterium]|nr:PBSX family phage terminase large subunit [bacterium]